MESQFRRFLPFVGLLLCGAIGGFSAAQQSPQLTQPRLPPQLPIAGFTMGIVSGPYPIGVKGVPYSAVEVTEKTQTLADGTHVIYHQLSKLYQDGQGRTRVESFRPQVGAERQDDSPDIVRIMDPVAGVRYTLLPRDHIAHMTTWRHPTHPPTPRTAGASMIPNKPASSPQPRPPTEDLGTKVVDGLEVRGTRTSMTIPSGAQGNDQPIVVSRETWYSPELHMAVVNASRDPRNGETVTRITNLVRDEPPADLFQVPPDYTVVENQTVVTRPAGSE